MHIMSSFQSRCWIAHRWSLLYKRGVAMRSLSRFMVGNSESFYPPAPHPWLHGSSQTCQRWSMQWFRSLMSFGPVSEMGFRTKSRCERLHIQARWQSGWPILQITKRVPDCMFSFTLSEWFLLSLSTSSFQESSILVKMFNFTFMNYFWIEDISESSRSWTYLHCVFTVSPQDNLVLSQSLF